MKLKAGGFFFNVNKINKLWAKNMRKPKQVKSEMKKETLQPTPHKYIRS